MSISVGFGFVVVVVAVAVVAVVGVILDEYSSLAGSYLCCNAEGGVFMF